MMVITEAVFGRLCVSVSVCVFSRFKMLWIEGYPALNMQFYCSNIMTEMAYEKVQRSKRCFQKDERVMFPWMALQQG